MKKLKVLVAVLSIFLLFGCAKPVENGTNSNKKIDVSTLNILEFDAEKADMSGYELLTDENHVFKSITLEDSIRLFDEKGSGVVYYGYRDCPFCQQAAPVINNAARDMGVDIYYVDVTSSEGRSDESYDVLVNHIKDFLKIEDGEPVFYVPQVFVIKDGVIVGDHLSLVESFDMSKGENMSESQQKELKNIYVDMIKKLQ